MQTSSAMPVTLGLWMGISGNRELYAARHQSTRNHKESLQLPKYIHRVHRNASTECYGLLAHIVHLSICFVQIQTIPILLQYPKLFQIYASIAKQNTYVTLSAGHCALPQDGMLRYSTILAMIPQGLPKFEFSSALCKYIYVLYTGYQTNVYHCASDNTQSRKGCPYFQSIHSLQLRATRINHFRANDFN